MRPSAPHYLPWSAAFLVALAALLALAVLLVELDLITVAYERLGLHPRAALALLLASLLGSGINLPIARLGGGEVVSDRIVTVYGVRYAIPWVERWPGTILALNVGGAVVPALLSVYLFAQVGEVARLAAVTALVTAVTHRFARPEPGVGIVIPLWIPPVAAALAAWFIAPDVRAAAAYVGGTLGTLIGADLLNLRRMRGSGAPVASIGGAGTFDGIFVTGIVAVLLA
jgi:uncharacterized membrane protein